MKQFIMMNSANLCCRNSHDIKSLAADGKELDFIPFTTPMHHDDSTYITRPQWTIRQINSENNPVMFVNHMPTLFTADTL